MAEYTDKSKSHSQTPSRRGRAVDCIYGRHSELPSKGGRCTILLQESGEELGTIQSVRGWVDSTDMQTFFFNVHYVH